MAPDNSSLPGCDDVWKIQVSCNATPYHWGVALTKLQSKSHMLYLQSVTAEAVSTF